jgi:predicted Zn-dependent protease
MTDRTAALRAMVEKAPTNALARFGLANELMKTGAAAEAAEHYAVYLAHYDDEGNGWGRYAEALAALGRHEEARSALTTGIAAAERFGHPGMAEDLQFRLEQLEG